MNTTQKPPQRFLTHDEMIDFPYYSHKDEAFRVRVWQGQSATPIVLASQNLDAINPGPPPSFISEKIANFVHSAILGYPPCGMLYFEEEFASDASAETWLNQVYFEYFGYAHRLRMYQPLHKRQVWAFLEYIIGGQVEH